MIRMTEVDREISLVRATVGGASWTSQIRCCVSRQSGLAETGARFIAPRRFWPVIGEAALRATEELSTLLPTALIEHLTVEAGLVRTTFRCDDGDQRSIRVGYCTAIWRGAVLGIWGLRRRRPLRLRWSGVAEAMEIRPRLPVVLGPSAALSVVAFGLEALGLPGGPEVTPVLTVVDGAASPYPPQDLHWDPVASDQRLIAGGLWLNRGSESEGADPIFFLLTRPERALRPHGVSIHFERRNLAIDATKRAPLPRTALIVDAMRPLVGPRRGSVPFDAELSLRGTDGRLRAVSEPVCLHCDPWELLARVRAGYGRPQPAVDRDPIEGNSYGSAPFLLLELRSGALLKSASMA